MLVQNQAVNHSSFLIAIGSLMAIIFGWTTGVVRGRVLFGIMGVIFGVGLAFAMGMYLPRMIADLQITAMLQHDHRDFYKMAVYGLQWITFVTPVVVATGIAIGRLSSFVKTLGIGLMATILGAVIYVKGSAILELEPTLNLLAATPNVQLVNLCLWALTTPVLMGLFMSRTRF